MEEVKESEIDKLKEEYNQLKDKYDLPLFYDMNKFFDIDEMNPSEEFLLRKIRRATSEKIESYIILY